MSPAVGQGLAVADFLGVWLWIRRGLGRMLLAAAVVLPFALSAVDHHGAERIPIHEHVVEVVDASAVPHSHGFEQFHHHLGQVAGMDQIRISAAAPTMPSIVPTAGMGIGSPITSLALVLALLTVEMATGAGSIGRLQAARLPAGLEFAPLTTPPRTLSPLSV